MPRATASDGVRLHWEERGSGPTVVMVPHWSLDPELWDPLTAELERDHRVVRYDDRGTGGSERTGPYDLETGAADLESVVEAAGGGPLVAVGLMDGVNKAVRVAVRRPDLVGHVVAPGGAPLSRTELSSSDDAMIGSNTVVGAFLQQLETDYRAAIRALAEAANPQMTQDETRARVQRQVDHVPVEAALARVREWADDRGAAAPARELGDRLVVLLADTIGAGWWPQPAAMRRIVREHFPEAVAKIVEDGVISRPDLTAAEVRERSGARLEPTA